MVDEGTAGGRAVLGIRRGAVVRAGFVTRGRLLPTAVTVPRAEGCTTAGPEWKIWGDAWRWIWLAACNGTVDDGMVRPTAGEAEAVGAAVPWPAPN